jgi:hypothetical protein
MTVWSGNDGNLTGPGTLDASYNPATSPLPIQLLFFKVKQTNSGHLLEWATVSEINFDYFSVERSGDGINFRETRTGQRSWQHERKKRL